MKALLAILSVFDPGFHFSLQLLLALSSMLAVFAAWRLLARARDNHEVGEPWGWLPVWALPVIGWDVYLVTVLLHR